MNRFRQPSSGNLPTVIFALLVLNGLIYALQLWQPGFMLYHFALWTPSEGNPSFKIWQLLSYGFLHDLRSLSHLLFNMFALWMFGRDIERVFGAKRFLIYYLVCVAGAGLVQVGVALGTAGAYPTVGASGGVFGLLLAFGVLFPNRVIMLIFPPIPMKAKYFVIVFGALELYLGLSGASPGVANFAHLGGMLFGFFLLQYWRSSSR